MVLSTNGTCPMFPIASHLWDGLIGWAGLLGLDNLAWLPVLENILIRYFLSIIFILRGEDEAYSSGHFKWILFYYFILAFKEVYLC